MTFCPGTQIHLLSGNFNTDLGCGHVKNFAYSHHSKLSVNLVTTPAPLSSEMPTMALKNWEKFCMGSADLRSLLNNIG